MQHWREVWLTPCIALALLAASASQPLADIALDRRSATAAEQRRSPATAESRIDRSPFRPDPQQAGFDAEGVGVEAGAHAGLLPSWARATLIAAVIALGVALRVRSGLAARSRLR